MSAFFILLLPLSVTLSVVLGIGIYYGWKLFKVAVVALSELLVMYKVFFGESSHSGTKRPLRLYTHTCKTKFLDEVSVSELYDFLFTGSRILKADIESKNQTISSFHEALLSYSHVLLYRDKIDGSLRGFTTIGCKHSENYTLLTNGPTLFKHHYKGSPVLYLTYLYFVLKELFLHPFTPLYVVGKCIDHHSYTFAMKFKESYPRYDRETPEFFKKIFDDFAQSELDIYDHSTNVLIQNQQLIHLPETLPISERDLQNPHIKYFVDRNPGYAKGHLLVSGWRMRWSDLMTLLSEALKTFQTPKQKESDTGRAGEINQYKKKPRPRRLFRGLTFQEESANEYATDMYQMGLGGEMIPSPIHRNAFAFAFTPLSPTASLSSSSSRLPDVKN